MAISGLNGKRDANGKHQTIVTARQSNKLARRMVRTHVLKDKSMVGKGLASMREPQPRSLHPREKRALRKAELERRAQAQVVIAGSHEPTITERLGSTTAERTILVLGSDQERDDLLPAGVDEELLERELADDLAFDQGLLPLANEPQRAEDGDQGADGDGGGRDE